MKLVAIRNWISRYSAFLWQVPGPLLLIGKLLIRGEVIYWGTAYMQFLSWRFSAWQMLTRGIFPLWNAQSGMGAPLLANYQSAFFYPPIILIWLGAAINGIVGIARAQTVLVMLHLIWGGLGMVLLTRTLGLSKTAQIISGMAFSLGSYSVARASFLSMNAAIAWIPWLMWSSYRMACVENFRICLKYAFLHTVFLSMQLLAGHAQLTWYTQLLVVAWYLLWNWRSKIRQVIQKVSVMGASVFLALGLTAVQLLPTAEYLLQSQRSDAVVYDYAVNYSFWGWRILSLFSPNLFGNPGHGIYWVTADNYWEDAVYFGFIPVILAIIIFLRSIFSGKNSASHARKIILFFGIVSITGLVLALGKNTPVFPFLYRYIPTFNLFQAPTRFNVLLMMSGAVLAGFGFDNWKKPAGRRLYWSRLGTMAGVGAVITSVAAKAALADAIQATYLQGALEASVLFLIAGILNLTFAESTRGNRIWQAAVIAAVLADLVYAGWFSNPGLKLEANILAQQEKWYSQGDSRVWLPPADEAILRFDKYFRFDAFALPGEGPDLQEIYLPNTNLLFNKFAVNNYDPFIPGRFDTWQSEVLNTLTEQDTAALAYLNIGMVHRVPADLHKIYHFTVENAQRYWFYSCAETVGSPAEALQKTNQKITHFQTGQPVYLESDGLDVSVTCSPSADAQSVLRVITDRADYQKLSVETNAPVWLVQMDTWYPGWQASVDGVLVPILRADYLFRGVFVPAGDHTIEFIYRPKSFMIGLIISGIALVGLAAMVFIYRRWRKA